jgi:hypothetical protein
VPSLAETVTYWLSRDSTSTNTQDYVLFRRVNARPAKVVAKAIRVGPFDTVFQYFKGDTSGNLTALSPAQLPAFHDAKMHGAQNDTGKFALIDSIRTVRVRMTAMYKDPRVGDVPRRIEMTIRLMNSGLVHRTTCGDPPIGVTPTATVTAGNGGTVPQTFVTISWTKSSDETSGEKDVERYALYRRLASVSFFDEPFASVPAGSSTYNVADSDVHTGEQWIYGVAAQDCTPSSSSIGVSATVTIP